MTRTLTLATVAPMAMLAALSLAACNKPAGASNPPSAVTPQEKAETPDAHPSATIPTPSNEAAAPDFVAKAASSDMFEIAAAKLALSHSHNADVKAFAAMMQHDHTASTKALKAAIAASGLTTLAPPDALPADLQGKLDDLNKLDADHFDKGYIDGQVDAHQAALDLMQRYAQDGDVAQIKSFAADVAPKVQEHLTKAKGIQSALKK
jgi:putative membrane protein